MLVKLWKFQITEEGIKNAVLMVARIIMLITGTFLLTYTTSPITLTDGLERLMGPLKKIHMPVHELCHDDDHCPAVYPHPDRGDG